MSVTLLLSDYASGSLDEPGRRKVESHITTCEDCRKTLAFMQKLAPKATWAEREGHSHPRAEMLRAYYEDPSTLEAGTRQAIEAHLGHCSECAFDMEFLKDLEQILPAAISERVPRRAPRRFLPQWLSRPVPVFSLVAVLAGVLLVVYFQINPRTHRGAEESEAQIHVLRPLTRGQEMAATITLKDPSETVYVAIPRRAGGNGTDYQFRVWDESESTEFDVVLDSDRSQSDRIVLRLNTSPLADGRYLVILTERALSAPTDSTVRRFPFELRTSP